MGEGGIQPSRQVPVVQGVLREVGEAGSRCAPRAPPFDMGNVHKDILCRDPGVPCARAAIMMLIESPLPGPPEGLSFSASVHLYRAVGRKLLFLDPFLRRESEVQNAQGPGSCLRYSVWSRSLDLSFLRGRNQERMTCCAERGDHVWPRMGSSRCALGIFYSHDSWKRHSAAL